MINRQKCNNKENLAVFNSSFSVNVKKFKKLCHDIWISHFADEENYFPFEER